MLGFCPLKCPVNSSPEAAFLLSSMYGIITNILCLPGKEVIAFILSIKGFGEIVFSVDTTENCPERCVSRPLYSAGPSGQPSLQRAQVAPLRTPAGAAHPWQTQSRRPLSEAVRRLVSCHHGPGAGGIFVHRAYF